MTIQVTEVVGQTEMWIPLREPVVGKPTLHLAVLTGTLAFELEPTTIGEFYRGDLSLPVSNQMPPGTQVKAVSATGAMAGITYKGDPEDYGFGWAIDSVSGYHDKDVSGRLAVRAGLHVKGAGAIFFRLNYLLTAEALLPPHDREVTDTVHPE